MEPMKPTTKAQVSGHKFLLRRLELGLALGDERMLHDPLGKRRKALVGGIAISVLLCLGATALAWLKPEPDPGDAVIVKAASGQLFVRQGEVLHPVHNLTSARLLAGEAAQPVRAGNEALAQARIGAPVGIVDAPGILPQADRRGASAAGAERDAAHGAGWSTCTIQAADVPNTGTVREPGEVTQVVFGRMAVPELQAGQGLLAQAGEDEYIVSNHQRLKLPEESSPLGRAIRRRMDIDATTPRWRAPEDLLSAIPEVPPVRQWEGEVLQTEHTAWLSLPHGVVEISELQRDILLDVGMPTVTLGRTEITQRADAQAQLHLPERTLTWIDPAQQAVCVQATADDEAFRMHLGLLDEDEVLAGAVALPGESVATHAHTASRAMGVRTRNGTHVIGESGVRHRIASEHYGHLGLGAPQPIPWVLLRLLPEGTELSPEQAATVFSPTSPSSQSSPSSQQSGQEGA